MSKKSIVEDNYGNTVVAEVLQEDDIYVAFIYLERGEHLPIIDQPFQVIKIDDNRYKVNCDISFGKE